MKAFLILYSYEEKSGNNTASITTNYLLVHAESFEQAKELILKYRPKAFDICNLTMFA